MNREPTMVDVALDAARRIGAASRDDEIAKLKAENKRLHDELEDCAGQRLAHGVAEMTDLKQRLNLFSSNPVFGGIIEETKTRIEQLEAELETERMRLVACGVVALANTPESASIVRSMVPQYRSGSCDEVEKAVDREMALRERVEQLEADRENLLQLLESASEVIGRFVSDEGWAQSDMDMMDTIDAEIVRMRRGY